jgi:hypothetical protein
MKLSRSSLDTSTSISMRSNICGRPEATDQKFAGLEAGGRMTGKAYEQGDMFNFDLWRRIAKAVAEPSGALEREVLSSTGTTVGRLMVVATTSGAQRRTKSSFYVWMSVACLFVAFGGFLPTYWLQPPRGTFIGPPLVHLHGMLFSGWIVFLFSQTVLAARGQMQHHRAWGMAGVALASAMCVVGMAAAIHGLQEGLAAGYGDRARAFFIVPVNALILFAGFFIMAIVKIGEPEVHKRLIFLSTIVLLPAALARVFFTLANGSGPGMRPDLSPPVAVTFALAPSLLLELLIVAGIAYDWRTRGRPHPVWLAGAAIITVVDLTIGPLSATPQWLAFANAMAHFTG